MNFFRKSQHNKQEKAPGQVPDMQPVSSENQTSTESGSTTTVTESEPTASVAAPQDFTRSATFQAMVREEAKRLRMKEQMLTEPHLARLREAQRLNETKRENIEENLRRTQNQLELLRRYNELSMELQVQKKQLYHINKQLATSMQDREALDRFEEFENIQGNFQRLTLLEMQRRELMSRLSELSRKSDTYAKNLDNEKKLLKDLREETADANRKMTYSIEVVNEAQLYAGRSAFIAIEEVSLNDRLHQLKSQKLALEKELQESRKGLASLSEEIQALRTRRQSLAPHQRMARHGELIIERLARYADSESELEKTERMLTESRKKQAEADDMLGRIYGDYQQILQDIQALQDELSVHRENILGQDSYRLQERSMQLRLRKAMLQSAQSLWNRIAKGYPMIEDCLQRINTLRLKLDPLAEGIRNLSNEVSILRHEAHEKEYTLTVGKCQNVIQLRSDLQEGVSCTVCGARHHPYHSDTMMEQNMLISDMKMEYESLAAELQGKEKRLREEEMEYVRIKATKEEAENTLITLRALQNGYVQDWQMFRSLDATFAVCDSTVNAAARTAIIQQLIENIGKDVETSQKELDAFNFHQQRINTLTEQIAEKEQKKNEIIMRLNEVNTGCQVMAGRVERVQAQKQVIRDAHSRMFETLDKMISLPDWLNTWNRSHEALTMNIQELTKECLTLNEKIMEKEQQRAMQENDLNHLQRRMEMLLNQIAQTDDDCKICRDRINEDEQKLSKLVGNRSIKGLLQESMQLSEAAMKRYHDQMEKVLQAECQHKEATGQYTECKEEATLADNRAVSEREAVDLWMQRYNANHPPVQYAELQEMFSTERNWSEIRARVRAIQMEYLLAQARVDKIGSQLVALQAEGTHFDSDSDSLRQQLITQIETLEERRRETMMQIATISLQLNTHERAESLIREDLMQEKR